MTTNEDTYLPIPKQPMHSMGLALNVPTAMRPYRIPTARILDAFARTAETEQLRQDWTEEANIVQALYDALVRLRREVLASPPSKVTVAAMQQAEVALTMARDDGHEDADDDGADDVTVEPLTDGAAAGECA